MPPTHPMIVVLLLSTFLLAGHATPHGLPDGPGGPSGDILLITVDTLRADHVGLYGYERETTPNLDRWFGDSAIYLRSYSTTASTSQSVTSLLTGMLPQAHRVRLQFQLVPDHVSVIPDLLPERYQCAAFVSNPVLTDRALGLADRFDHYDDLLMPAQPNPERDAAETTDAVVRWLDTERDPARPLFLWVHYMDPHGLYRPPEAWSSRFTHGHPVPLDENRVPKALREPGVTDGLDYVDRYDGEIAYTDAAIDRLLKHYARDRSLDETLLMFTADHAESMMEHEFWFTHGHDVYEEVIRVPLMVRGPGVKPGRVSSLVSGTDLAPTVLQHAEVPIPDGLPEVDLRTGRGLSDDRIVYSEARVWKHYHAAIRSDRKWRLEVDPATREITDRRTYDLSADPEELEPQDWPASDAVADGLIKLCREDPDPAGVPPPMADVALPKMPTIDPRISKEERNKLEALGYVD